MNNWIPVEEKLPEKDGWYLVTTRDWVNINSDDTQLVVTTRHFDKDGGGFDHWVTAWLPLPEPYTGGANA